ncbi:hypothetical protein TcasGA2_TC011993 [Tribolium castaneum]|uniref:F-box domain-containing protein n=1 Tax=Tribolium castaneum TaxID=7070 RepID=D6X2P4_TRICA|nr:PREDICTED: uncharacterized protein LOC107398706 [Tribolium castaneum]EFA09845.1 hypothetical protein TcasGA2_TC011993 [Tribolium castaneum]|eukprot:XP_015839314.1 PREDICTED: uncharacterized protein LOC107398706 [Tribolium castaneum]
MYQVLPFLVAANFALPKFRLPVEMWSTIFRFLDPSSLLNVVRTDGLWSEVGQGDPVLRRTLQEELMAERQRQQQEILNPGLLMTVERKGPTKMFGANNGTKTVRSRAPTVIQRPPVEFLQNVEEKCKRRRNGGWTQKEEKNHKIRTSKMLRL